MLVNIHHDTPAEHRRLLLAGIAFLTAIAVLISLSIAIYQKVFTPVTMVTVHADRAGLQLPKFGDVRMHGVLVGQVRSIGEDGKTAVIKLGLDPAEAKNIPANVDVEILPTTLFGQKYVALMDPARPVAAKLHDGSSIPASRVKTNVELEQILANLFPLLRSIRPADLDSTLNALATALEGRGEKLGATLSDLNSYLTAVNVHLPTVRQDLVLLAKVSKTYSLAAPDLVRLLRNATTTAHTIVDEKAQITGFYTDLTGLASTGTAVLTTNEQAIIREGQLAAPLTRLLDTYSPEYPCLLEGAAKYTSHLNQIFNTGRVSQTLALDAKQRRPYNASDKPEYGEIGHGPWCLGLPNPKVPAPPLNLADGTDLDGSGN